MKVPQLTVMATPLTDACVKMKDVAEANNPDFELARVQMERDVDGGTHYAHLNRPHKIWPVIEAFINKHQDRFASTSESSAETNMM